MDSLTSTIGRNSCEQQRTTCREGVKPGQKGERPPLRRKRWRTWRTRDDDTIIAAVNKITWQKLAFARRLKGVLCDDLSCCASTCAEGASAHTNRVASDTSVELTILTSTHVSIQAARLVGAFPSGSREAATICGTLGNWRSCCARVSLGLL